MLLGTRDISGWVEPAQATSPFVALDTSKEETNSL